MIFHAEQSIAAPPAHVWRYLTEPDLITAWMPNVTAVTTPGSGPVSAGMTFHTTVRGRGQAATVVDFVPGERLALRSTQATVTATYTYSLAPDDRGTCATLTADCTATGLIRLVMPLIAIAIRRTDGGSLGNLCTAVEAPAAAP